MSFNDKRGGELDEHNMRPFPHQQNDSQRQKTPSKLSPVTSQKNDLFIDCLERKGDLIK